MLVTFFYFMFELFKVDDSVGMDVVLAMCVEIICLLCHNATMH